MDWLEQLGWDRQQVNDLRQLGYAYIRQGSYSFALPLFEALILLDAAQGYDLQVLGGLHLQMGNGVKALEYIDRALQLDPTHEKTLLHRAKALFMLGYRRQGILQAGELQKSSDLEVATQANALILAYQ